MSAIARPKRQIGTCTALADPATMGWPPTLPVEIAMKVAPIRDICEAHGIERADWDRLRADETFVAAVQEAHEALKRDGMSFRVKARLQSEELLKTAWAMIHAPNDEVPANVKADLLKFTIKAAGLDGSKDQLAASQQNALSININLG